ncbi:hypothetical protein ES288_A08G197900v1 [Gossypium darwinii]|uniref:Fe2OG dioxygenase domain-containing protein n=1 Tax=Gossypium darwinii TaxID=34276 RepID=A0A5D2FM49_GOSDA|nr:hypothetical protein ES288_A08G197900v1 [Gossypium darwinii]
MDGRVENLGWVKSSPVPSVQEIVRSDSQSVPERYVHENNKDGPIVSQDSANSLQIPVIDFSFLAKGDEDEVHKLHLACKDWGFFQLSFELPIEEKKKYGKAENEIEGYGQNFGVSQHEKLDWSDMIYLSTLPSQNRNFKFWPLSLPGFKEALEEYSREMQKIGEEIQANLSVLMGLKRDELKSSQGELKQGIRINYYPTCSRPHLVLGVSPHSDGTSFTLLLQDDDVSWIPVKPIPNSLVLNIDDATEIQSNGMYKSIEHRVITNEKKARISIATFMFPDDEQEIGPLEAMIDDQNHPRLYRNIKYVDYIREKFSRKMEGKVHIQFVKLHNK